MGRSGKWVCRKVNNYKFSDLVKLFIGMMVFFFDTKIFIRLKLNIIRHNGMYLDYVNFHTLLFLLFTVYFISIYKNVKGITERNVGVELVVIKIVPNFKF